MTILLGCTVWIPLMLWITAIIHWTIANEIEVVSGVLGVGAGLGLGVLCLRPPVPFVQPLAYVTVYATMALFPFVRAGLTRRELRSVDLLALEKAYGVLNERPGEAFGQFRLAMAAWTLGMMGHAMRIAEGALERMDSKVFKEEHMIVRRWHREQPPASVFVDYPCLDCGGACPPGRTHCPTCGAPFLLDRARGKLFNPSTGRKIVVAWTTGVVALVAASWAITLPPAAAIGAIVAILGLAFLVVFLTFRPQGQSA